MQKFRDVLSRWENGQLSMPEAGELLGMSERQFRRCRDCFEDERHPIESENRKYLTVRCNHAFGTQEYRTSGEDKADEFYHGFYEFLPSDIQFRMLPVTPKPRVFGVETAKVVAKKGEDGEEISTDENGHIWIQFYRDREPQKSCPIRVAQCWSGKQWGEQHIPRISMEVVVEFLEGDPDRPLVVGCVFNGDNKYPYDLPNNKTQSGWKSDSTKGHYGYNEFMFEDKKGSELIRMHPQKALAKERRPTRPSSSSMRRARVGIKPCASRPRATLARTPRQGRSGGSWKTTTPQRTYLHDSGQRSYGRSSIRVVASTAGHSLRPVGNEPQTQGRAATFESARQRVARRQPTLWSAPTHFTRAAARRPGCCERRWCRRLRGPPYSPKTLPTSAWPCSEVPLP